MKTFYDFINKTILISLHTILFISLSWSCKKNPPEANEGNDTTIYDQTYCYLNAEEPSDGTGQWYIISGELGAIEEPENPKSKFSTMKIGKSYTLSWKVTNDDGFSTDDVKINFMYSTTPSTAFAGNDTIIYDTNICILDANTPKIGNGSWNITSGNGGSIDNNSNPNAILTGVVGETYVLEWTISLPDKETTDNVTIKFQTSDEPTPANAGNDIEIYYTTQLTLNGNTPYAGTGQWTILSGTGGTINSPSDPQSTFTGTIGQTYLLEWAISTSTKTSADTMQIAIKQFVACGDTMIDTRDNQKYSTVQIGTQCWMGENMNIGTMINGTAEQTDDATIQKYCYNNSESNCDECGGLYQWDEMMQYVTTESSQGICPSGYHVPSDEEWKTLEKYLGMTQTEADQANVWRGAPVGDMLKEGGSSGYNEKLCGRRPSGGGFYYKGTYGYPYTSTESGGTNAWRRCLANSLSTVGRWNTFPKDYAFSVRCLKD